MTRKSKKGDQAVEVRIPREKVVDYCDRLCQQLMAESRPHLEFFFELNGLLAGEFTDEATDLVDHLLHFGDLTESQVDAFVRLVIAKARYEFRIIGFLKEASILRAKQFSL